MTKLIENTNAATDLVLAIERCQAVIQSFADEYIDCDDKEIFNAVMMRTEHYCNLFNVIAYQIDEIKHMAAEIEGNLAGICKARAEKENTKT